MTPTHRKRTLLALLGGTLLNFAFYVLLARRLGVEAFGRYGFALSFTMLFGVLADLGLLNVFAREAQKEPRHARALLGQVMTVKLALGLVTMMTATGITLAVGGAPGTLALVAFFTTGMLVNSSALLFDRLLEQRRPGAASFALVAQSGTVLAAGAAFVLSGEGVQGGAVAYFAAALVHLGVAARMSRDLWSRESARAPRPSTDESAVAAAAAPATPLFAADSARSQPSWHGPLGLLREAAPLALSGAFIATWFNLDAVLLQAFRGTAAVGLYAAAYRCFEGFVLLSGAYRSAFIPVMPRAADGPEGSLGVLYRKSIRLHLLVTVGIAVFFSFEARKIVTLLLGADYAPAAPALAILMWALPGAFMADTLRHLLATQRRQQLSTRALAATAIANVLLNLSMIPLFSIVGAAATMVACQLLSFAFMYVAFTRHVPRIDLFAVARAPLFAGGVSGAALVMLSPLDPGGIKGLLVMATFAATAYMLALVTLGAFARQDFELIQLMLPAAFRPQPLGERRKAVVQA